MTSCWRYLEKRTSESLYGRTTMSFSPLPLPAWCQASASCMAAFLVVSWTRVRSSISLAPARKESMSIPWRAAGTRPTVDMTEVLPPTQSSIGRRVMKLFVSAYWSSLEPSPVMATVWAPKFSPASSYAFCASSMALRVSAVPPDLDTTRDKVLPSPPVRLIFLRMVSQPAGSVLSKKNVVSLLSVPSASYTSCGPSAEPPMPMMRRFSNRPPEGGATFPWWTSSASCLSWAMGSVICALISAEGASSGFLSQ